MQLSWSLLMLVTQHVSGIIMPIIRSTRRDDKPHTVFCTGRAVVELRRWGGSRVYVMAVVITTAITCTSSPQVHYCTTSTEHRMWFVIPSCTPDDGHNDAWNMLVTNINKLRLNCIKLFLSSALRDSKMYGHMKLKLVLTSQSTHCNPIK
jgi:hypothetical protein